MTRPCSTIVALALLTCTSLCGAQEESAAPELPRDAGLPDPTGSLPPETYAKIARLVGVISQSEGWDRTFAEHRLFDLCIADGPEASLNALYAARRIDAGTYRHLVARLRPRKLLPPLYDLVALFDLAERRLPESSFVRVFDGWSRTGYAWGFRVNRELIPSILDPRLRVIRGPLAMTPGEGERPLTIAQRTHPLRDYCSRRLTEDLLAATTWWDRHRSTAEYIYELCVLAFWSFARGDIAQSSKLHTRATSAFKFFRFHPPYGAKALLPLARSWLETKATQEAVLAAESGESWADLRARWATIVKLRGDRRASAPTRLPDLDRAVRRRVFTSPSPEEMLDRLDQILADPPRPIAPPATGSRAKLAEYWANELTESRASRKEGGTYERDRMSWGPRGDPARELRALGWNALPAIIRKLDDKLPTRGHLTYHPRWRDEVYYIVARVSTIALELFTEISGRALSRREAEEWWKEAQTLGGDKYSLERLRGDRFNRYACARWLMFVDPRRYLPAVLKQAERETGSDATNMLHLTGKWLGPRHAPLLEPFVTADDIKIRGVGAGLLAERCNDPRGTEILVGLIGVESKKPGNFEWHRDDVMRSLAWIGTPDAVEAICKTLRGDDRAWRVAALEGAQICPDPRVLNTLIALASESGSLYPENSAMKQSIQIRDGAVDAIRWLLDRDTHHSGKGRDDDPELRDRLNRELITWVKANRESIDWEAQRKRIRAND